LKHPIGLLIPLERQTDREIEREREREALEDKRKSDRCDK